MLNAAIVSSAPSRHGGEGEMDRAWVEHNRGKRHLGGFVSGQLIHPKGARVSYTPGGVHTCVHMVRYVFGWGKNIGRHFICILMGKKRQGKELYKVIGGPALDDSVVRETTKLSVALKTHRAFYQLLYGGSIGTWTKRWGTGGGTLSQMPALSG